MRWLAQAVIVVDNILWEEPWVPQRHIEMKASVTAAGRGLALTGARAL